MQTDTFRTTAQQWITTFDQGAHRAIAGWRCGADRLGTAARQRWDTAFAESSPELSEETRHNASHLRDVVSAWYVRGVELSTTGAERAVDAVVQAAQATASGRMAR